MNYRTVLLLLGFALFTASNTIQAGGTMGGNGEPGQNGNGTVMDTLQVEGAVMSVDEDAGAVVVQTDEGLTDTISITEQTVFREDATLQDLEPGQRLRFHYLEYPDRREAVLVEILEPANGNGNGRKEEDYQ
ncbi:MAG: hypothetical protein ACLFQB_10465 [Chitinispirillaceae bacterium]